jgi:hypothetical protein
MNVNTGGFRARTRERGKHRTEVTEATEGGIVLVATAQVGRGSASVRRLFYNLFMPPVLTRRRFPFRAFSRGSRRCSPKLSRPPTQNPPLWPP